MQQNRPFHILMSAYKLERQMPTYWQVNLLWRFENRSNQPFYVLLTRPLKISGDDPLILDHSAPDDLDDLYANQLPGFRIVSVDAQQALEEWLPANVPVSGHVQTLNLVGRFGANASAPNQDWESTKNWLQVGKWQQRIDSHLFTLGNQP